MNVFIDTNILLDLYEASRADLVEVEKLLALAENGRMTLLVSPQVRDEFLKNREHAIKKALDSLEKQQLEIVVPNLYTGLPSRDALVEGRRALEATRLALIREAREAIQNDALDADRVVRRLLRLAGVGGVRDIILERARRRVDLGNPPGASSYGDAVNWEWLIDVVEPEVDLHIITRDGDYTSRIDNSRPSEFLAHEWSACVGGTLSVHKHLLDFVKSQFPSLLEVRDVDKHLAIEALATSPNFGSTHHAIARLARFESFNSSEKAALLKAIAENNQVHWIITDADVMRFTVRLLESLGDGEHVELAATVRSLLYPQPEEDEGDEWDFPSDEDLPF